MKKTLFLTVALITLLAACGRPAETSPRVEVVDTAPGGIDPASPFAASVLFFKCDAGYLCNLRPVNPLTGQDMADAKAISLGRFYSYAFSPDGKMLAVAVYPSNSSPSGGKLHLIDLQTWEDTITGVELNSLAGNLAFSPDGSRLAIATDNGSARFLLMVDVSKQEVAIKTPLNVYPGRMQFTTDGAALMIYGSADNGAPPKPQVALLSATDLSLLWQETLPEVRDGEYPVPAGDGTEQLTMLSPAAVFSPGGSTLYIIHADADKLTTVKFADRAISTVEVRPAQSLADRLIALTAGVAYAKAQSGTFKDAVLSKDGQRLYVVSRNNFSTQDASGTWWFNEKSLGLQVIDVATGAEVKMLDTDATEIKLSPDGTRLYLGARVYTQEPFPTVWTKVLDADSLVEVKSLDGQSLRPARRLDGKPILLESHMMPDGKTHLAVLDPETFEVKFAQTGWYPGEVGWLTEP